MPPTSLSRNKLTCGHTNNDSSWLQPDRVRARIIQNIKCKVRRHPSEDDSGDAAVFVEENFRSICFRTGLEGNSRASLSALKQFQFRLCISGPISPVPYRNLGVDDIDAWGTSITRQGAACFRGASHSLKAPLYRVMKCVVPDWVNNWDVSITW
jgi:hypothetical protein